MHSKGSGSIRFCFFFQAEDGIRDIGVTGVQTCALPICYANFFHGLFLLGFVLLLPNLIHRIPLAALGAMLVYTGFRLASPREFVRTYRVGSEQFVVFVGTILATLATDLLIGIGVGIALEVVFH